MSYVMEHNGSTPAAGGVGGAVAGVRSWLENGGAAVERIRRGGIGGTNWRICAARPVRFQVRRSRMSRPFACSAVATTMPTKGSSVRSGSVGRWASGHRRTGSMKIGYAGRIVYGWWNWGIAGGCGSKVPTAG